MFGRDLLDFVFQADMASADSSASEGDIEDTPTKSRSRVKVDDNTYIASLYEKAVVKKSFIPYGVLPDQTKKEKRKKIKGKASMFTKSRCRITVA